MTKFRHRELCVCPIGFAFTARHILSLDVNDVLTFFETIFSLPTFFFFKMQKRCQSSTHVLKISA